MAATPFVLRRIKVPVGFMLPAVSNDGDKKIIGAQNKCF